MNIKNKIEKYEIIERIARGLRRVSKEPDGLIFTLEDGDNVAFFGCDTTQILGITVFFSSPFCRINDDTDCPFIPIWKDYNENAISDVGVFRKAWEE